MKRADAQELRRLMVDRVKSLSTGKRPCLALSGGIDSVTVLFAMLEAGLKPRCYTFFLEGNISDDLKSATKLCRDFGVEHVVAMVPKDLAILERDCRDLVSYLAPITKIKKTIIQCLQPWLYTGPEMVKKVETDMFIGFAADNYYCNTLRDNKRLRQLGEEEFKKQGFRNHRFDTPDCLKYVDGNVARFCYVKYGVTVSDIYASVPIQEWFKKFPIKELGLSEDGLLLRKAPAIYAFEDYYSKGAYTRQPSSYQVNSGIREHHDLLLEQPHLNPQKKTKAVISIYRSFEEGSL